jgi:hypothetical protein
MLDFGTRGSPGTRTAEDGETTVRLGDVVDEFLDEHCLADTGTSEQTNFAATGIRGKEIHDLDTRLEHLSGGRLVDKGRWVGVNGGLFDSLDGPAFVNGLSDDIHDAPKRPAADGDHDGGAGIDDLLAPHETLGTVHGNGADTVLPEMRGDLEDQPAASEVLNLEGVQNGGQVLRFELHVDDRTDDGLDGTDLRLRFGRIRAGWRGRKEGMRNQGRRYMHAGYRLDTGGDTREGLAFVDCLGLAVGNVALDKTGTVEKRALDFLELIALRERRVTPREVSMLEHGAGSGHGTG